MAMNVKSWGPLAAAVVLGGIAAKAGYDLVNRKPAEKVVVKNMRSVATAKEDIAAGTSLKPADVVMTSVPETAAPGGTFDAPERLNHRVVTVALRKGQPIFETMLNPEGSSPGLTAVVPEGMRAVTMEINEVSGVAGLIVPGCRVDVVSTFPNENGLMMTKTICRSLQIVATGRKYTEAAAERAKDAAGGTTPVSRDGDAEPPLYRSVTLLVTPREAEIIDLAAHTGAPRLVLRSGREAKGESGMSEGITVAELRGATTRPSGALGQFFASLMNPMTNASRVPAIPQASVEATKLVVAAVPATQPTQSITIIRRTQEQTVSVPVQKQPQAQPLFVDTDQSNAIPGK